METENEKNETPFPALSIRNRRRMIIGDTSELCSVIRSTMALRTYPPELLLSRCAYVSGMIREVNEEASDLCRQASECTTYESWEDLCEQSCAVWDAQVIRWMGRRGSPEYIS